MYHYFGSVKCIWVVLCLWVHIWMRVIYAAVAQMQTIAPWISNAILFKFYTFVVVLWVSIKKKNRKGLFISYFILRVWAWNPNRSLVNLLVVAKTSINFEDSFRNFRFRQNLELLLMGVKTIKPCILWK